MSLPLGRGTQLRFLTDNLRRAYGGEAQVVVLTGEAGSGKSTLIGAALDSLGDDAILLRAEGHRAESEIPFAGLHQLLLPVADGIDALALQHRDRLKRALDGADGAPSDVLGVANSVLALIADLAGAKPVVVVVDDLQWLDASSRQTLIFVARRLDADAVCFVFALRRGTDVDDPGIGQTIHLGPLDATDARAILRQAHPDLSAIVMSRIIEYAAGLPLALAEIPLELTNEQRTGAQPLPARIPIGPTIERLYERRLGGLTRSARMALLLASFDDLDRGRLRRVLAEHSLSMADFDLPERSNLVRIIEGRCVFRHPTVRAALHNAATAAELAAAHATLARCFAGDAIRRAYHLGLVPEVEPTAVVDALVAAASQAMRQGGFVEAADAWSAAARHSGSSVEQREFSDRAVRCYLRAGAGPQAEVLLRELITSSARDDERARYWTMLLAVHMWTQASPLPDTDDLRTLGAGLAQSSDGEARTAGLELLSTLVMGAVISGDYRAASIAAAAMRSAVPQAGLPLEQQLVCDVVDVMVGADGSGGVLRSDWVQRYPATRLADPAVPIGIFGVVLGWLGEVEACASIARRLRELASGSGFVAAQLAHGSMTAVHDQAIGLWDRVGLAYSASEAMVLDSDFTAPYPFIALRHAYVLAAQGREPDCSQLRQRARDVARIWTPAYRHLDECIRGLSHLSLGEYGKAAEALDAAAALESEMGSVISGYTSRFADQFEAYWHAGRADELLPELRRYEEAGRNVGHPTMLALAARCRAMLRPDGDVDDGFGAAVALHEKSVEVFETARTRLLWGMRLRRARRKADARVQLNMAFTVFESLEASAWLDTCRSELAACGERRISPETATTSGPLATLTPREYDVAQAVAQGASNAGAAERLFVSERTVEFHLRNVYRKLGLANRSDLAAVFSADPGTPAEGSIRKVKVSDEAMHTSQYLPLMS